MTESMTKALEVAKAQGGHVFAGYNVVRGRQTLISARTLDALARRGVVTLSIGPDGGMLATLTENEKENA